MQIDGERHPFSKGTGTKCPRKQYHGAELEKPFHFACMTSITCLRGSVLILLAPVNG